MPIIHDADIHRAYSFDGTTYTAGGAAQTASTHDHSDAINDDNFFTPGETVDHLNFAANGTFIGHYTNNGHLFMMWQHPTVPTIYLLTSNSAGVTTGDFPASLLHSLLDTTNPTNGVTCFTAGTRIATPTGETAVEELKIGDEILTADGRSIAVKWLGRQTTRALPGMAERLEPVRIRAGALTGGLPRRDLTVSADHGMIVDGLVVNASALVNGATIDFVPLAEMEESFVYYHVETEGHEAILAEGAPTETFVDVLQRMNFDNHQEYLDLYGAERIIPEMDRPRISSQRMLPRALKERLGIRAVARSA